MKRLSPGERMVEEYYDVQQLLQTIRSGLRERQAEMTLAEFRDYLERIGMDEAAGADFLASDGTVEGMTARMWVYFESPLRPRKVQTA